jgi:predicted acylesterase/phospholipase RssA
MPTPKKNQVVTPETNKIVLAVQGSFGHIFYATGMLDAFRAHLSAHNGALPAESSRRITFDAGSGCVEMLMPLSLFLNNQNASNSFSDVVLNSDNGLSPLARESLAPQSVRPDAWKDYFSGLIHAQYRWTEAGMNLAMHAGSQHALTAFSPRSDEAGGSSSPKNVAAVAKMTTAIEELAMYGFGLPGQYAFNPLYVAGKKPQLDKLFSATTGPTVFTNATQADDFSEVYLYSGAAPNAEQEKALSGVTRPRQLLRLNAEYFFASGARPPYFAPMPVSVNGKTQHWIEGAMRCNPPLTPLIDIGATRIVLIRFFAKDHHVEPHNNAEMNDLFLDAVFNIPLQKEIESIELNNKLAQYKAHVPDQAELPENIRNRREITILDPADRTNQAFSPAYNDFLTNELDTLSHYSMGNRQLQEQMIARGREIGAALITHLQKYISDESSTTLRSVAKRA